MEQSNGYANSSPRLWQWNKDDLNYNLTGSEWFTFKEGLAWKTSAAGNTKNFEIAVELKIFCLNIYLIQKFWRTFEISLINCKTNFILTWSGNCVIINSTGAGGFLIRDKILYISVVALSNQDNTKQLKQLQSVF